jgi:hypothetical protein
MAKHRATDAEILAQLPAARARARQALTSPTRIVAASFDATDQMLVVRLANATRLEIPLAIIPALRRAASRDIAAVTVDRAGLGVHWERLDLDIGVAALLHAALGPQALMAAAGAAGGRARSNAKSAAARANGRLGGRPKKSSRGSR